MYDEEITKPENWENWPTIWKSCYDDGYKAGMKSEALEEAVKILRSWADNESPWKETFAFLKEQEKWK